MNSISPRAGLPPAQTARLGEIEVLRTIAVLMVLVHHLPDNLLFWPGRIRRLLDNGGLYTGVDLFFAISGFVIARSLLPRLAEVTDWMGFTRTAITFWIARAWRLLPSSWFWLAAPLLLCLVFNRSGAYGSFQDNWQVFIAGMFDMENFHEALAFCHFGSGTAFAQWSLSLEEQFYIVLPFAAFFFRRRLVIPLLFVAIGGFILPVSVYTTMLRIWPAAAGVLLAMWSTKTSYQDCAPTFLGKNRMARIAALVVLLTCLICVGSPGLRIVPFIQGGVTVVASILVWIASYGRGFLWQEGLSRRAMEIIAARSYSLYLIHIPVYFGAHELWFRLHGLAIPSRPQAITLCVLALLTVAGLAELNHRLLERPLREHGKRLAAAYRARTMPETLAA